MMTGNLESWRGSEVVLLHPANALSSSHAAAKLYESIHNKLRFFGSLLCQLCGLKQVLWTQKSKNELEMFYGHKSISESVFEKDEIPSKPSEGEC